jgi:hypothetical protein
LRERSHAVFAEARARNDLGYFTERMAPMIKRYYDAFRPTLPVRIGNRLKKLFAGDR